MIKSYLYLLLSIFIFSISTTYASKKLIVKGSIVAKAVGEGMSCGMTSQLSDFKNIGLVINSKDTLKTEVNEKMEFIFPAIKETDVFQLIFFYYNTNDYLNKKILFIPNNRTNVVQYNAHRDEYNVPQLSTYLIHNSNQEKVVDLTYVLYCFLIKPYEPAGLKFHEFPLQEAPYYLLNFTKDVTVKTNQSIKGILEVFPQFAFQLQNDTIIPFYTGFSFKNINLENASGNCYKGPLTQNKLPCKLDLMIHSIHQELSIKRGRYEQIILGRNGPNVYFAHQTFVRIQNEKPLVTEMEDSDPPSILTFNVQNLTRKTIYFTIEGVSSNYDAGVNVQQVPVKPNETVTVSKINFSMNNPKNFKAKVWMNTFPNDLFTDVTVLYGKKKVKIPIEKKWILEKKEDMKYTYTLIIGL